MRYRYLFILLLFSLSACTFQVNVLTPEPSVQPEFATDTPYPPETGILTATPPPFPTFTSTPTIIPSPIPKNLGTTPIRFAPNGTYIDVVDSIEVGTSKTYSINAVKGQIMSVSTLQNAQEDWTVIPLTIVGADGERICPSKDDEGCVAWRGVLPASQDYFVTLTPLVDVRDFTLRVAINPLGVTNQSFQYVSHNQHASFTYTDEFAPGHSPAFQITKSQPEFVLSYIDTQAYTETNLVEAYIMFSSSSDEAFVQTCTQPVSLGVFEQVVGDVNINGVKFVHSTGNGAAAGNFYEQSIYRTAQSGFCDEIVFVVHSFNRGSLLPQTVVAEYDRAALLAKFESIVSTLVIK